MVETTRTDDNLLTTPYWWEGLPPRQAEAHDLPARADTVVIGGGLTGCSAAATLVRAGRQVVILEAEHPGYGASARGAGFFSRHFKYSLTDLVARRGKADALVYFHGLKRAFDFTLQLIRSEKLDCALQENGRFIAAMDDTGLQALKQEYALRGALLGENYTILEKGSNSEYCSPRVRGGVLLRDQCAIHPGRYALAMANRAEQAGALLLRETPALKVKRSGESFIITTPRGQIVARNVLIATNGYTDAALPAFRRRLVPIRGYMIATEPLPKDLVSEILPNNRTYTDRRKASNYLRLSSDGTRLIFGGQTGANLEHNLPEVARRLRGELSGIFPQLVDIGFSHIWTGRCAAAVDMIPKLGVHDGMHYALGYCFSGNALAPYLGHHAALAILGETYEKPAFETQRFPAIPFHNGNPWFVPLVQKYYELRDRFNI